MKSYSVYFPNTDLIQEILADRWEINKNNLLTFYQIKNKTSRIYEEVSVFNMNNILGFKENCNDN